MGNRLELHEHWYISGPRANCGKRLFHSHEGGDRPHAHETAEHRTGPGAYTIDKGEWFARTGLRGGGRKKFSDKPTGEQFPVVFVEAPQIKVVIVGDGGAAAARGASGPGLAVVDRLQLAVKARVVSVEHVPDGSGRRARRAVG
jgi:hypothetical protein